MKFQNYMLIVLLFLFSCKKDSPIVAVKSADKKITAFKFASTNPEAVGIIDEITKKITINVPYGTVLTSLLPTISVSEKASVNNSAAADFSKTVVYKVTAEDGTTQEYQVTTTSSTPKFTIDTYTGPTELEAGYGYFLLKGKGFGTDATKAQVIFVNSSTSVKTTIATPPVFDDASVGLIIPETLAFGTYSVQLVVNGETVVVPVTLVIVQAAPKLESLSKASLAQSETLTLNGRFFATGSTLSVIFKSKSIGTSYTFNNANATIESATATKIEVKVASLPGGTYTVQVASNGKVSNLKDVEVVAPAVIKPAITNIDKSSYATDDTMVITGTNLYKAGFATNINFTPFTSGTTSVRSAVANTAGTQATYKIPSALVRGTYIITIEVDGKYSNEYNEVIQIK